MHIGIFKGEKSASKFWTDSPTLIILLFPAVYTGKCTKVKIIKRLEKKPWTFVDGQGDFRLKFKVEFRKMDLRKVFAHEKKIKRYLWIFTGVFLLLTFLWLGKNSGGDINIIWVFCLILAIICGACALTLELLLRQMKKEGSSGQKLRDCLYRRLRRSFESGDAKMNVGLTLTIMDYYLDDETKERIMELSGRAKTEDEELLVSCGEQILRLVIESFEGRPDGGRGQLSAAERAMYDRLRRAITGVVHKSAGF